MTTGKLDQSFDMTMKRSIIADRMSVLLRGGYGRSQTNSTSQAFANLYGRKFGKERTKEQLRDAKDQIIVHNEWLTDRVFQYNVEDSTTLMVMPKYNSDRRDEYLRFEQPPALSDY